MVAEVGEHPLAGPAGEVRLGPRGGDPDQAGRDEGGDDPGQRAGVAGRARRRRRRRRGAAARATPRSPPRSETTDERGAEPVRAGEPVERGQPPLRRPPTTSRRPGRSAGATSELPGCQTLMRPPARPPPARSGRARRSRGRPRSSRAGRRGLPRAAIRPSSITTISSASAIVERRWAMITVVRSRIASRRPSRICASVVASTDAVASSRIRMRGSTTSARAIATRWRWPPESVIPRSPITVSYPSGSCAMNSCACASRAAARSPRRVASGRPKARFSRTVAEKRNGSCAIDADLAPQGA